MKFLKNLKIKNKLRIPIIFLLILAGTFIYFYFKVDSLMENHRREKAAISEARTKMCTLLGAITGYFNGKIPYDGISGVYREIQQLPGKEDIFTEKGMQYLAFLEQELKNADTAFKEISRLQEQVFERTASYDQQALDFLSGKKFALPAEDRSLGTLNHLFILGQTISRVNLLFIKAKEPTGEEIKLAELLEQASQEIEKESQSLRNTPFIPLTQKAKEAIAAAKEIAPQFTQNIKNLKGSKEKIAPLFYELPGIVSQGETEKNDALFAAIKDTFRILLGAILVIILLTVIFTYITAKFIRLPLGDMIERAHELAVGKVDMTKRLEVDSRDEIGQLSSWFNQFLQRIHQLLVKVKSSSDDVYNATKEITAGSEDLAARTNEQAASITETSTTLEKFTEAIRQNTENSAEADMMLVDFNQQIQERSSLIDNVTSTMTEIYDSSKQIDNIIKVINDISFQTNLLALNAAVEAARAGEAGRGFAVVASEVRNLAQKTAESSKTIQDIVLQNVESTQKGMELVKHTSEFFSEIVGVMGEIVQKVSDITTVSREQSANIEQISQAIAQMDQVANRNAAMVGELSETGKKVKTNAIDLQELVLQFSTAGTSPVPGAAKPPKEEISKSKAKPSSAPPVEKKKEKAKEVEKRRGRQDASAVRSTTPTEEDFFGATNDEGFEEF